MDRICLQSDLVTCVKVITAPLMLDIDSCRGAARSKRGASEAASRERRVQLSQKRNDDLGKIYDACIACVPFLLTSLSDPRSLLYCSKRSLPVWRMSRIHIIINCSSIDHIGKEGFPRKCSRSDDTTTTTTHCFTFRTYFSSLHCFRGVHLL